MEVFFRAHIFEAAYHGNTITRSSCYHKQFACGRLVFGFYFIALITVYVSLLFFGKGASYDPNPESA